MVDPEMDTLDHPRIDQEHVVDRYLAGRLSAEDTACFEEHLFACQTCLAAVEAGEAMRRGLAEVAAQDAVLTTVGRLAWWRRRAVLGRSALGALALLLVVAPLAWWLWSADGAAAPTPSGPTADLLVVSLGPVRAEPAAAPIVRLASEQQTVLLTLDLPTVEAPTYRVVLRDARGEALWRAEALAPNLYDSLWVAVPASFLASGEYRIEVVGQPVDTGASVERFEMAFRVVATAD